MSNPRGEGQGRDQAAEQTPDPSLPPLLRPCQHPGPSCAGTSPCRLSLRWGLQAVRPQAGLPPQEAATGDSCPAASRLTGCLAGLAWRW